MPILKCKMCGGDLNIEDNSTVCECEYCGSKQTISQVDDEKIIKLYERANRLRMSCEFDKAATVYESIIAEKDTDAEAYWGLVLCKFGIEYVDDPASETKIPTCHRSSFDSVIDDPDFEMVMENADAIALSVYREQAKQIEEIRKGIIEVSGKEQPYDIFICYKETDENGDRTVDSVIAQDVYDALTDKGYRVFFSRITLEDKLGTEYEPYIFAALNSAKVMLAFGTKFEYYNAVWVKNEWSRFIKLMAKDKGKYLIPCFKDIDAYDMPKEFSKLQSQDMGKVGAIQDLVRGIDKLTGRVEKAISAQPAYAGAGDALTQRGMMYLEDGNFSEARDYFNRALDTNPTDSNAYFGLFLVSLKLTSEAGLGNAIVDFDNSKDFKRAVQFANPENAKRFQALVDDNQARREKNQLIMGRKRLTAILKAQLTSIEDYNRREAEYTEKVARFEKAESIDDYEKLKADFQKDLTFKDSKKYKQQCEACIEEAIRVETERNNEIAYNELVNKVENTTAKTELDAIIREYSYLSHYSDAKKYLDIAQERIYEIYYQSKVKRLANCSNEADYDVLIKELENEIGQKDSAKYVKRFKDSIIEAKRENAYKNRITRIDTADSVAAYGALLKEFSAEADYKDSKKYIAICEDKIAQIRQKQDESRIVEIRNVNNKNSSMKKKVLIGIGSVVIIALAVIMVGIIQNVMQKNNYKTASVGATVYYGNYNGKKLEWIVIAKEDNKMFLLTKDAVIQKTYNDTDTDITWEKCALRKWLNTDFYSSAFNSEEQSKIVMTNVSADSNPAYSTDPGNSTQDKVFLLSCDEMEKYLKSESDRSCKYLGFNVDWLLRTPGEKNNLVVYARGHGGGFYAGGTKVCDETYTKYVRPAIWVELES